MNDDRPIEKLLRRYAKKRRDEAGPPVEMHPATRRLLQGEVASQFKRQDSKGKKPGLREEGHRLFGFAFLTHYFPRLAWAVPMFALVGVGLWLLLDRPATQQLALGPASNQRAAAASESQVSSPEPKAAYAVDDDRLRSSDSGLAPAIVPARSASQPAPRLAANGIEGENRRAERALAYVTATNQSVAALADAAESKGNTARYGLREAQTVDKLNVTSSAAPAPRPSRVVSQEPRAKVPADPRPSTLDSRPPSAAPVLAAASLPASLARNDGLEQDRAGTYSQSFANLAPEALKQKAAKDISPVPISPVLVNFRVEQTGRQLRVVDSDGSTYIGETELSPATRADTGGSKKEQAVQLYKSGGKLNQLPTATSSVAQQQQAQNNFYRVAGTNRTLNQAVVFTWSFVEMTNEPGLAQSLKISSDQKKEAQKLPTQFPAQLQNSFINGRAQFGTGQEIEINAVPVSP
jgi:hypothetical protein